MNLRQNEPAVSDATRVAVKPKRGREKPEATIDRPEAAMSNRQMLLGMLDHSLGPVAEALGISGGKAKAGKTIVTKAKKLVEKLSAIDKKEVMAKVRGLLRGKPETRTVVQERPDLQRKLKEIDAQSKTLADEIVKARQGVKTDEYAQKLKKATKESVAQRRKPKPIQTDPPEVGKTREMREKELDPSGRFTGETALTPKAQRGATEDTYQARTKWMERVNAPRKSSSLEPLDRPIPTEPPPGWPSDLKWTPPTRQGQARLKGARDKKARLEKARKVRTGRKLEEVEAQSKPSKGTERTPEEKARGQRLYNEFRGEYTLNQLKGKAEIPPDLLGPQGRTSTKRILGRKDIPFSRKDITLMSTENLERFIAETADVTTGKSKKLRSYAEAQLRKRKTPGTLQHDYTKKVLEE